jgi:chromosome segregation ATPase
MTKEPRTPAQVLLESRQKASREKRAKVLAVVDQMKADGDPITFLAVAKRADVSNWLVYAEGVREHIEAARAGQAAAGGRKRKEGSAASAASLATDLEFARAQVRALTQERDRLRAAVQRSLGERVDAVSAKDLVARIQELTVANQQLAAKLAQAEADGRSLQTELAEAQDDLAAARTALRNMMRDQNRDSS